MSLWSIWLYKSTSTVCKWKQPSVVYYNLACLWCIGLHPYYSCISILSHSKNCKSWLNTCQFDNPCRMFTPFLDAFLPGFLDNLAKDEKILVISVLAFGIVFISTAIGCLVCVLSSRNQKYKQSTIESQKRWEIPSTVCCHSNKKVRYHELSLK